VVVRQTEALAGACEHVPNMVSDAFGLRSATLFTKLRVLRILSYFVEGGVYVQALAIEIEFNFDVGALVHLYELLDFELHKVFVLTFVFLETEGLVGGDLLHDVLLLELGDLLLHQLLALLNAVHLLVQLLFGDFARHQLDQVLDFIFDQVCLLLHGFV
jgi:hypothetical protein